MKRITLIWVIVLVTAPATAARARSGTRRAIAGAASSGQPAGPAALSLPRAHLVGFACHTARLPVDRSVSVGAVMRPITGTEKMQMRFELVSKSTTGGIAIVPGNGLDAWISPPDPTLGQRPGDVWVFKNFRVTNLPSPATYHYRVTFRWIGAAGRVISTRTRASIECYEPELRPGLRVSSIAVQPIADKPGMDEYVAAIENDGQTAALGPFTVTFTAGAPATPGVPPVAITKTLQRVGAGTTRDVTFVGPACTASTAPTVAVDLDQTVGQYDYTNNVLAVDPSCPALTSAPVPTR